MAAQRGRSRRSGRSTARRNTSLERHLVKQLLGRRGGAAAALLLLLLLVWADHQGWLAHDGTEQATFEGQPFIVARVIDGDTIVLDYPDRDGKPIHVRLWGIDTPEIAHAPDEQSQPFGDEATALTRRLCEHQAVTLTLEPHRIRDKYDRLLAFITLTDGTMLNERLLQAGLARFDPRWTHRHLDRFELIERQARYDKVGMWSVRDLLYLP